MLRVSGYRMRLIITMDGQHNLAQISILQISEFDINAATVTIITYVSLSLS